MKGYALWLASKINTLIYVAAMFGAFAFYFTVQQDFQGSDFAYRSAEDVARLLDVAAASPGDFAQNVTLPPGLGVLAIKSSGGNYFVQVASGKYSAQSSIHAKASEVTIQKPANITISKSAGAVTVAAR